MSDEYECLEIYDLPDDYFKDKHTLESILSKTKKAGASGFPPNSLNTLHPIPLASVAERILGGAGYIGLHVVPGWVGSLAFCHIAGRYLGQPQLADTAGWLMGVAVTYLLGIWTAWRLLASHFLSKWDTGDQNTVSQRNNEKYFSIRVVWPKAASPSVTGKGPAIFCMVPHGLLPLGTWVKLWQKVWTRKRYRWTAAPALFSLPVIKDVLSRAGVMPARASNIRKALMEEGDSVGVVLDGVAGIFTGSHSDRKERVFLGERKAIVAIALQAGVPIVPVYVFGHTDLYDVVVDPFGLLKYLSCKYNVALSPFIGRWGWPFGPPRRVPLLITVGDPVLVPPNVGGAKPDPSQVEEYHGKLVGSFVRCFDTHKAAYGWPDTDLVVE
mmetsp:Transcript_7608/g.17419  ORF Transcript_7608/g.17419 Transcript_7608/m.17419 type:complete len:383 (+) Transcript_7608:139-1287(+)